MHCVAPSKIVFLRDQAQPSPSCPGERVNSRPNSNCDAGRLVVARASKVHYKFFPGWREPVRLPCLAFQRHSLNVLACFGWAQSCNPRYGQASCPGPPSCRLDARSFKNLATDSSVLSPPSFGFGFAPLVLFTIFRFRFCSSAYSYLITYIRSLPTQHTAPF